MAVDENEEDNPSEALCIGGYASADFAEEPGIARALPIGLHADIAHLWKRIHKRIKECSDISRDV